MTSLLIFQETSYLKKTSGGQLKHRGEGGGEKKMRERMSEGGKVLSLRANTVEEVPGTSCLPSKTAPLYQPSKHKPQLLPRTRQSPYAVASLSHSTVEQSWWHTAQNNLLRHTAQGRKSRWPQQSWGCCADGAKYLPSLAHTHGGKQGSCTR